MKEIGVQSDDVNNKEREIRALTSTFEKSFMKQRRKMAELMKRLSRRSTVFQFTAYPNFKSRYMNEFQLTVEQKSTIIFQEDIQNFSNWWKNNVTDLILDEPLPQKLLTKHEEARNVLLAVWCTDKKGNCDTTKCSLGSCISDIDEQLRSARFTFRQNNPEVTLTPSAVKEFLGIDNLTKQQYDLVNSPEKLLWINGAAGTGKTIVLLTKMLQLALASEENKIVFLSFNGVMTYGHGLS